MILVKFGGTSVGDTAAIERLAEVVRSKLPRRPIVVVSAMGGATNALIAIAEQAADGQLISAIRGVEALRERHLTTAEQLLGNVPQAHDLMAELSATFDEHYIHGIICVRTWSLSLLSQFRRQ